MNTYSRFGPLFKYMRREHALSLVNEGRVRIGTLYDFRKMEKYGSAIGDDYEGRRSFRADTVNGFASINQFQAPGILIKDTTCYNPNGNILLYEERCPNAYLFCASYRYDKAIMKAFDCDTCVVIPDQSYFFACIASAFEKNGLAVPMGAISACIYENKSVLHKSDEINYYYSNNRIPMWIQKDPAYEYQAEVRAVWEPKQTDPEPVLIQYDGLKRACQIIG